ncbi:response regulator [Cohnella yongneupensis]|uniref:Response regulator n=1 Tax=Cohnella yongneupensis TaxID=425006 RepID=A0ABW0QZ41_9BACL
MKKVMLVDDEIVIRENIRDCVDWEREGFVYCGDASDGELALPMIESLMPDILITDIKMPFLNGLELSAIVRKRMPDTKIIILSGHDEFEYARSALRIGIEEYCLKPISATDLVGVLRSVSLQIDKERSEKERLESLRLSETGSQSQSREKLLADICTGMITTAEALDTASALSINLMARYYAVVITDIRCSVSQSASLDYGIVEHAEERLRQKLSLGAETLEFRRSRTERVWILKHDSLQKLDAALDYVQNELKTNIEATAGCCLSLGIGNIHERLQHVHSSYLEADEDKHWRRLLQSAQNRWSLRTGDGAPDPSVYLDRQRYVEFLKIGSPADIGAVAKSLSEGLRKVDWRSDLYGFYMLNDLTLEVFQTAKSMYRNLDGAEASLQRFQQMIGDIASWEDASRYLAKLAEQFWQWRNGAADRYADMLEQAKTYILRNFGQDRLSLQDVADHVCVSASHLSKVFSQETGQTFIEFLTHARIRRAMELLQTTSDKSYEIAHQVGYSDAHYFSNLFKKVTGMTTKDFRKQGRTDAASADWEGATNEAGGMA